MCAKNNLLKIRKSEKFTMIRANGEKAFDIEIPHTLAKKPVNQF